MIVLIRGFKEKIIEVYGREDITLPVRPGIGQGGIAIERCARLAGEDYMVTGHHGQGHCLAEGLDPRALWGILRQGNGLLAGGEQFYASCERNHKAIVQGVDR